MGQTFGEETVTLNVSQLPQHNHGITESPHTHSTTESAHTHTTVETPHSHSLSPFRQYAEGNGGRGDGAELTRVSGGSNTYPNTTAATTGVTVNSAKTNLSINTATTGITINSQGGGGSHNNLQPSVVCNYIIKF